MGNFKRAAKKFGKQIWDLVKGSIPALIMYCCAGTILMMLTLKQEQLYWDNTKLAWTLVCVIAAAAYNGLVSYAQGGSAYEMLVSGNVKRMSASDFEGGYKMSSHKEVKEYRAWKGFACGAFAGLFTLVSAIIFGCNQSAIDAQTMSGGFGVVMIICFLLSGWSLLPFWYVNLGGNAFASYFLTALFALIPIVVSGVFYIVGAYARRNKAIREQEIADRAARAQEQKVKKINYGGLPGTKPKKRK